ncbi:MAG: polysaccharide pyruvyl transferase CsaB [Candidatus Margulisbacteria bacterium GWF2_35_9]|nr:MAG: polysaccharide pyruvyl transferase CsaB [Candidatus Margulisbacteria bacterium GWF2_35_9]
MKVTLVGYFGHGNTGDEAILHSIIGQLKRYHNPVQITVLSNTPEKTSATYNVISIQRKSLASILASIRMSNIIIFAGGTLFQDITSIGSLLYYLSIIVVSKIFHKKVILYSQGIEPFKYYFSKLLVKQVFVFTDFISVRDLESRKYLLETLKLKKTIRYTVDSAMMLNPLQVNNKYKGYIGINLMNIIDCPLDHIAKALIKFSNEFNKKILYIPFQEGDIIVGQKLERLIPSSLFEILDVHENISELLGIISQLDLLMGARLHSLILSATVYTPFIGIHYYDKVQSFSREVSQNYIGFSDLQNGVFYSTLVEVLNNRSMHRKQLERIVMMLKEQSKDSLINNILIKYEKT